MSQGGQPSFMEDRPDAGLGDRMDPGPGRQPEQSSSVSLCAAAFSFKSSPVNRDVGLGPQ